MKMKSEAKNRVKGYRSGKAAADRSSSRSNNMTLQGRKQWLRMQRRQRREQSFVAERTAETG